MAVLMSLPILGQDTTAAARGGTAGAPATPTAPTSGQFGVPADSGPMYYYGGPDAQPMGFFTDTTICIGCKACEVACKNWNHLPAANGGVWEMSGDSYDNTRRLDGIHWRHVKFVEQFPQEYNGRWLLMSDVCKHCVQAGCLEVCPTGAIIRTEFDTVVIQSDVCNGCRACIAACPFGVIDMNPASGTAQKCTLCYDRISVGLEPACSKACPTDSIQFGTIEDLRTRAQQRVEQLRAEGATDAYLYGADPDGPLGGLNAFFLLVDEPEVYGLPRNPQMPTRNLVDSSALSAVGAVALGALAAIGLRKRRMDQIAAGYDDDDDVPPPPPPPPAP
jgi:formate dehydrogenase iron-sulfur subunit